VVTCAIVDPAERLVAQAPGWVLVLPGRPWLRPVHVAEEFPRASDRSRS